MSHQQRKLLGDNQTADEERLALSSSMDITLGQIIMPGRETHFLAKKHEIDINSLKQRLEEKEDEIADLNQKLKDIQKKNNDLQIKLKTKDKEVEQLKERIQQLEDEKKDLQDELTQVETKLKRLENDVKSLTKSSRSHEEENQKLKENLEKVEYSLKTTEEKLTSENEKLKKEVKQLKETRAVPIREPSRLPIQTPENLALLQFGELCCQIQDKMYKKVLPKHYSEWRSYKVKHINNDVKKLPKTDEERKVANEKWALLKSKLNWSEELEEAIKSLQKTRNVEAHPIIDVPHLENYAKILEDEGILKGWLSLDRAKQLIDIWKRLSDCTDVTDE